MKIQDSSMTHQERLQLITEMIQKARFNFSQGSFYFISWGILLFCAACFEFIAGKTEIAAYQWTGWPVAGILGGIISGIYSSRLSKTSPRTHLDRVYSSIWMVFFFTLIIFIVALASQNIYPGNYILIITGLPTMLTGYVLRFNPLKWGGLGFWALGLASLFFLEEYKALIFALAMIQGYIVPGFLMKRIQQ